MGIRCAGIVDKVVFRLRMLSLIGDTLVQVIFNENGERERVFPLLGLLHEKWVRESLTYGQHTKPSCT